VDMNKLASSAVPVPGSGSAPKAGPPPGREAESDDGYPTMELIVHARVSGAAGPLFTTDLTAPFEAFLNYLPAGRRQHYNCKACRRFFDAYAGLVTIDPETGQSAPALWGTGEDTPAPPFFRPAVDVLRRMTCRAAVRGVFVSSQEVWGTPEAGGWTHFSGVPASGAVWKDAAKTAEQRAAELAQDYLTVHTALKEFPRAVVAQALRVLTAEALPMSERALGVARWFDTLRRRADEAKGPRRNNVVWAAVAAAPPGYAHVRSTMIGTLLDDILSGADFETVRRRWAKKADPLKYQRPESVKSGTLEEAERLVEKLGCAASLRRRYATLADVSAFTWRPAMAAPVTPAPGSVFGHLKARGGRHDVKPLSISPNRVTWEKFSGTVLPRAVAIDFYAANRPSSFYGLVTAADPDAPAIVQWDGLAGHARNPVTWYFYNMGSYPTHWGLTPGEWVPVTAVFPCPAHWQSPDKFSHQMAGAFFALAGARDANDVTGGSLFPALLRAEFHGIRAAVEAYNRKAVIAGRDAGDANGIAVQHSGMSDFGHRFRVTEACGGTSEWVIDRWD
jgi:hypothetical protein